MDNNYEIKDTAFEAESKKAGGKKPIVIAICILLAITVVAFAVGGIYFVVRNSKSHVTIVKMLEDGKYSEAIKLYEEKYGLGNGDTDLIGAIEDRLFAIEDDYYNGEITYNSAIKELETIRAMGIKDIEESLQKTESYVLGNVSDSSGSGAIRQEAPSVNLGSEPLPSVATPTSGSPTISSATTLYGDVLPMSDVNSARSFGANKTIDGYYDSCWCVNTPNTGAAGASIRYDLSSTSTVNGVMIVNGNLYQPQDNLFSKNGQIKSFTLTFSDGSSQSFTASFNGNASSSFQTFYLSEPVVTDSITLTVDSGYVGSKFTTNVCLGEFKVF